MMTQNVSRSAFAQFTAVFNDVVSQPVTLAAIYMIEISLNRESLF
jgi:hypothetical protein